MKMKWIVVISLLIWMVSAPPALACGSCMFMLFDRMMPPILFWCAWSLTWFLSMAILSSNVKHLIFAFVAILSGIFFFGPIAIFSLVLVPIFGFFKAIVQRQKEPALGIVRKCVLVIGLAHVISAIVGTGMTVHTLRNRTETEYVVKWSGSGHIRPQFQLLRNEEPGSIEAYRYIVQNGFGPMVSEAAERLGSIGDPTQDVDILRIAGGRASAGDSKVSEAVDAAIKALEKRMGPDS
jgi:hypothetical protein